MFSLLLFTYTLKKVQILSYSQQQFMNFPEIILFCIWQLLTFPLVSPTTSPQFAEYEKKTPKTQQTNQPNQILMMTVFLCYVWFFFWASNFTLETYETVTHNWQVRLLF